ncbi:MAG: hypothetical protein HXY30_08945 [Pseudorhodoplanes sp.]|nr:hypothetical protein [Pseudorhodoplanes sp.]
MPRRTTKNGRTPATAEMAEINALLGDLEQRLARVSAVAAQEGSSAASATASAADNISRAVVDALIGMADRVRESAGLISEDVAGRLRDNAVEAGGRMSRTARNVADDAFRFGTGAIRRIADQAEQRPLLTLAIAAGVGYLAGLAGRRH